MEQRRKNLTQLFIPICLETLFVYAFGDGRYPDAFVCK